MKIFLSYSHEARSKAEPVAFSLRARGHKVFLDKDDLPPGNSYEEQIESAIEGSDIFVFLITEESLTSGRFTQTELAWVRKKWPAPNRHVLPVLLEECDLTKVPTYLKSVTILNPHGNVAAEVSAAVADMAKGLPASTIVPILTALGLGAGLASAFLPNLLPDLGIGELGEGLIINQKSAVNVPLHAGPLFGGAIALALRYSEKTSMARLLVMMLTVTLAWLVAVNTGYHMMNCTAATPSLSDQIDSETRESIEVVVSAYETVVWLVAGAVAGLLGSSLTCVGVRFASRRMGRSSSVLLTCFTGAMLGCFFYLSPKIGSTESIELNEGSFRLLYVVWQTGVGAAIAYALSRPLR